MLSMTPYRRRENNLFSWMDEMERSFFPATVSGNNGFRCDITDKGDHYLLEAELPGFEKNDIHVDLEGDILTISAANDTSNEEKDPEGNVVRRERRYGSFRRSFDVSDIDVNSIEAGYKNGILELSLPKVKEIEPPTRKIEVQEK